MEEIIRVSKPVVTSRRSGCMTHLRFVDVHIHLSDEEYDENVDEIVNEARTLNVCALVSNSMDLETSFKSIKLAEKYRGTVYAALGIHPWNVGAVTEEQIQETCQLIEKNRGNSAVVAIGEVGLDYKYEKIWDKQLMVFDEMLHLAEKLDLPVIIHSRGTTAKIVEMLPSYGVKRVLLHWFSNPLSVLRKVVEKGYYISEGPPTAYSNGIQEVIRRVPITNLLTETDGPVRYYKGPFNGKTTTPALISIVVRAVADIKKMNPTDVAEHVVKNFEGFLQLKLN